MKRVFLLIVVPALLVAMGFAQTPAASGNTDQINVKGCMGGTDANYTVAEDNTGKIYKITTSTADLKAYAGQEVNLVGHKAGTGENSVVVTEVNMVSEHCTVAPAAPAATVSAPAETASTPPAAVAPAAAAPAAVPDASVSAPAETAGAPATAAAVHQARPSARHQKPAVTPAAAAAAPAKPVSTPAADVMGTSAAVTVRSRML